MAKVIGMQTVEPRAIAYVACQVSQSVGVAVDHGAIELPALHGRFGLLSHLSVRGLSLMVCSIHVSSIRR